jgi:hypothetical protein
LELCAFDIQFQLSVLRSLLVRSMIPTWGHLLLAFFDEFSATKSRFVGRSLYRFEFVQNADLQAYS